MTKYAKKIGKVDLSGGIDDSFWHLATPVQIELTTSTLDLSDPEEPHYFSLEASAPFDITDIRNTSKGVKIIRNSSTEIITLKNNAGTGGDDIITGTGADVELQPEQVVMIAYDSLNNINVIVGGVSTGGGGAVDSVNGQTGTVVLDTDDIAEGSTNKYWSNALTIAATLTSFVAGVGTVTNTDTILTALQKVAANAIAVMTGATAGLGGTSGRVPAPSAGDQNKAFAGSGAYRTVPDLLGFTPVDTTDSRLSDPRDAKIFHSQISSTVTTDNTERVYSTKLIPANYLTADSIMEIDQIINSPTNSASWRIYFNATPDLSGSPVQVALRSSAASVGWFKRTIFFYQPTVANTTIAPATNSLQDGTTILGSPAFNKTVATYLVFTAQSTVNDSNLTIPFLTVRVTKS
jgi:hypothetical protein